MEQLDDETREIVASFITEAHERLDDAEAQLVNLGSGGDGTECLNSVFRLFHSLKGSAGYLGFESIKRLTHEAETLLDCFLKGKATLFQESVDVIYQTIDALRRIMGTVERESSDLSEAEAAGAQAAAIKAHIEALKGAKPAEARAAASDAPASHPAATARAEPAAGSATGRRAEPHPSFNRAPGFDKAFAPGDRVSREMPARFLAESADLVIEVEKRALHLAEGGEASEAVDDMFRAVHTMKGNAGFFGHALLERRCRDLESFLDTVRRGKLPAREAFANSILSRVDGLRSAIASVRLVEGEAAAGGGGGGAPGQGAAAASAVSDDAEYKPLGEILIDIGAARENDVQSALEAQERPLGQILLESGAVRREELARALEIQKLSGPADKAQAEEPQRREIRVDTAKLDKLFELVGELITAEAMVGNSPDLAGLKLEHFSRAFAGLGKISREIQETTMMIRMIPLECLFHKMTRLVRDLSRKSGKPIELSVSGQETEMDKNVIEQISDPLVHILRNAMDHGIEDAARRAELGKPKAGSISLDARYEGSEIWVTISDDGAGLSRSRIVSKAQECGLLKGEADSIPDGEIWKLIFEPGFSTAETVSEVSGRGVGMDVVKRNIERIRGRVDIRTREGRGTDFILKIPLTMAIIDGITVRSGSNFYSIPLGDILEFFKAAPAQLTATDKGEETVNLRGSILPLVKLGEIFSERGSAVDPAEGIVLVVQGAGRKACLLIDEVVGNQQIVVKSMSEYLGKVEGISGCSILGDGTVSFIVDTARLISRRLD